MNLLELNKLKREDARVILSRCCHCDTWVEGLLDNRPYESEQELRHQANLIWSKLSVQNYLEAFRAHPKIGDLSSLTEKYSNTRQMACEEQSGVREADNSVIGRLANANIEYERKFGFIFIVCATGKSASEMLKLLEARINNDKCVEISNAAEEQRKIFQIRLGKLL